jgi:peptide/nickel transport system permease protein
VTADSRDSRFVQYALVLVLAITLNFALPRLMPGNPLALLAGVDVGLLTAQERQEIMVGAGLDRPLHQQYLSYWGDLLQGDLGYSYRQKQPIADLLGQRLPWTLLLAGSALVFSTVIGSVLGTLSAWRRAGTLDIGLLWSMITLNSLPSFWLGMLFIAVFAVRLGWLPAQGAITPAARLDGWQQAMDVAKHAVLPVLTLSLLSIPDIYLTVRYTLLDIIGEDFVRTATAKGLSRGHILFGHVLPNALPPIVTMVALRLGYAFGGAVVVETVFSYPGLGRLIFEAVGSRDYPVMQAAFLLFTVAVLLSNILADLLYRRLDPRLNGIRP